MAIKLDIALEQLAGPGVAEALARLVGALGEQTDTAPGDAAPKAVAPRDAAPKAVAPRDAAPKAAEDEPDAAERYRRFVAGLPERSRKFIEMVQSHKLLKISDAMRALGLTAPKAMGGLTGSIGRWAPNRGVKVPYQTTTADGERAWRWIGSPADTDEPSAPKRASETPTTLPAARPPVLSAPPPASPPVAASEAEETPAAKPPAKAAKAPAKAEKAPAKAAKAPAKAEKAPAKAAKAPAKAAKPAESTGAQPDLRAFEGLPEKSQQFLTLVATRGIVTREEALEALDYRRPKEMGGATEPIIRRCREREIDRPYVAGKRDGKRVWLWPTHPVPDDVQVG